MLPSKSLIAVSAWTVAVLAWTVAVLAPLGAQPPAAAPQRAGRGRGAGRGPAVVSPEILPDHRVVFRIQAPRADAVTLDASDIPGMGGGRGPAPGAAPAAAPATASPSRAPAFQKNESGIWEATVGPIDPGAYRYVFTVDGVRVVDPVNPRISESNANVWSLFYVPGADFMDTKDVPHGAVAAVFYYSSVLQTTRRMHVYTPPGYEANRETYPVFYLLHGSGDCDEAWTSIGRAGFILDNLIAAKKIKPMIVVMPAGHQPGVSGFGAPQPPAAGAAPAVNPFTEEFTKDIMPYAEKNYRINAGRAHRAIAGLSMGGSQTLDIAFRHLDQFAYIGVFSSGATLGGGRGRGGATAAPAPAPAPPDWATIHQADLDNAALKKGTKLVWLSTGVDDGLIANTRATVEILKSHGFQPVFQESPGAHTWINWRNYLNEFAPQLFQ